LWELKACAKRRWSSTHRLHSLAMVATMASLRSGRSVVLSSAARVGFELPDFLRSCVGCGQKKVNGENEGGLVTTKISYLVRTRTFSTSSMKTENSLP